MGCRHESQGVKVVRSGPADMCSDGRGIEPLESPLGEGRGMRTGSAGHVVEPSEVIGDDVEVREAGQDMGEFHGPGTHAALNHHEPRPEPRCLRGARTTSSKHDDSRGVKPLASKRRLELTGERIHGDILAVDLDNREHLPLEIRPPVRHPMDVSA